MLALAPADRWARRKQGDVGGKINEEKVQIQPGYHGGRYDPGRIEKKVKEHDVDRDWSEQDQSERHEQA